ncbi:aminotransferase class I/II-fold pyridoxal phosphate-dependent enzyme [Desulfopila aestuarii]|uniref:8-amino-7-oxononanoate synthase n=1 Tax=Desulfopila aestuarii DSM 18488 TaxID=1121416 RepID=A0A1M7Y1B2_9BACT|nr:8-amino-7-oxononanoate synthase [Desulfopila aestuarii]SHO45543.1 8-amino-7-oxononanoate synthase [Desulfopila aestuarii DSM 18488]
MKEDYGEVLANLAKTGRLRELNPLTNRAGCWVKRDGRTLLNLSSNDYLGLAGNKDFHARFYNGLKGADLLDRYGLGSASSRLLSGDCEPLHELENALKVAYGFPSALFYNSGYHANIGILPALFDKRDIIISDKLNHASIHDGMRLSLAAHKRYRHLDYDHLESILVQNRPKYERAVIVSESVFSMDGDVADLQELVRLKERYNCLLYIDEAHALGVSGPKGLGEAEAQLVLEKIDILVGPFGKACASIGSFVLCTDEIRSFLVNHCRSMIFTTALPPIIASWNLFVFKSILEMADKRQHLKSLIENLRHELVANGLHTYGSTNIVPVVIGGNQLAVDAAGMMQDEGFLVLPVRPPTVPEGTARFRLSLTADMSWSDLAPLASKIARCLNSLATG